MLEHGRQRVIRGEMEQKRGENGGNKETQRKLLQAEELYNLFVSFVVYPIFRRLMSITLII